jgi:hypothetical protein
MGDSADASETTETFRSFLLCNHAVLSHIKLALFLKEIRIISKMAVKIEFFYNFFHPAMGEPEGRQESYQVKKAGALFDVVFESQTGIWQEEDGCFYFGPSTYEHDKTTHESIFFEKDYILNMLEMKLMELEHEYYADVRVIISESRVPYLSLKQHELTSSNVSELSY